MSRFIINPARIRYLIVSYARSGITPRRVAAAVALGTLIAFVPMVGVHTIMALGLASLIRLNPLVVLLGTQISNPLTFPFQLFISAEVGSLILHGRRLALEFNRNTDYLNLYITPILVGSIVLGIIASCLAYMIVITIIHQQGQGTT
jgi:uncharacterized protein